jgi:hypothetical protein
VHKEATNIYRKVQRKVAQSKVKKMSLSYVPSIPCASLCTPGGLPCGTTKAQANGKLSELKSIFIKAPNAKWPPLHKEATNIYRKVHRKVSQSKVKKMALSYVPSYLVLHFAHLVVYPAARQRPKPTENCPS